MNDEPIIPPHNLEAEQSVLGAILLDGSLAGPLSETLNVVDFYSTSHRRIYASMLALVAGGGAIDNITLAAHLNERGALAVVGGVVYIAELVAKVAGTSNVMHHAGLIVKAAELRRIREQLIKVKSEIEAGGDIERIKGLLPDPNALQRSLPGDTATLPVVTAATLLETEEADVSVEWTLYQLIARGALIGLIAKPKVGKTTLIYELAVKVALGLPFLGRATRRCGVLVLALEEHKRDVSRRLRTLGAENLENLNLVIGPLDADEATFAQLKRTVEERAVGLIIVDTLNSFWGVRDENNASEVTAAIKPLLNLARSTNAAIVAIHHSRKSEGEHGDEIRGSNALFSLFDAALLLKRHDAENQRKLTVISRWPETPSELIIELRDHGYECLGDSTTAGRRARLDKLAATLSSEGQTAKDLSSRSGVPFRSVHGLLDELVQLRRSERLGTGRKGDPFKFVSCLKRGGGA
ncbi:MAG: AAA family ATPase [Nitrospira sp.]|nr:AAA family ATPase [Nitrospira sp.]